MSDVASVIHPAPADELCRYLLEKAQVALVPGSAFGNPECIRISYAAADEVLAEAGAYSTYFLIMGIQPDSLRPRCSPEPLLSLTD